MSSDLQTLGNASESTLHSQCCVKMTLWWISHAAESMGRV
jgi:hypothetical protein